jgi:hypothetical protein
VEDWIRRKVVDHFGGSDLSFKEEGPTQVIRGPEKGQVFYLSYESGWMIVSNSESGWKDVQLVLAERGTSLAEKVTFREIVRQLGGEYDLLFYFSGESGSLLPECGYSVRLDGEEVYDSYYSIDSQMQPQSSQGVLSP